MSAVALLAFATTILSSCASPGDGYSGPLCDEPGITADQVRLGLLYPRTGNASTVHEPFRAGVDARLGVANDHGGVHGREVTYLWRDDRSLETANLSEGKALVERDQVFGLVESSSVASGSADYLAGQGIPVTGTSLEPAWAIYPNMFSYSNYITSGSSISTWGDYVAAEGGHRAVIIETTFSETSRNIAAELARSMEGGGVQVVAKVDVGIGAINTDATTRQIIDSGADAVVGAVTAHSFHRVAVAARDGGANVRVALSPTGYDLASLQSWKERIAGFHYFVDYVPFEANTAPHRAFLDAMVTYAPYLSPPSQQAALAGWISADMFLRGLREAGPCPSRAGFIETLRSVKSYDAGGLLPAPINFAESFGKLNPCYSFVRVKPAADAFEVVNPTPRCGRRLE